MRNRFRIIFILLLGPLLLPGQKPYYAPAYEDWRRDSLEGSRQYVMYLIGDAGLGSGEGESGLALLRTHLAEENHPATVVFLGDNSYPNGLPEEGAKGRQQAEKQLGDQVAAVSEFGGEVFFIPGNHDWNHASEGGWEALARQENFLEGAFSGRNVFLPDRGCPGPVAVALSDDLVLILIDTQWWLHAHDKPAGARQGCEVSNEMDWIEKLSELIEENSDKSIVVAGHHPVFSNGNHGGKYSAKSHLFPLTSVAPWLYLPLPGVGSIYPLSRKGGVSRQDFSHPRYQDLREKLIRVFSNKKNLIYASGHEHSLQYFPKGEQHFIVSGSGSKNSFVAKGRGAAFTYSQKGFSKLVFLTSGEIWLEFWAGRKGASLRGERVFRTRLKGPDQPYIFMEPVWDYSDSTLTLVAGNQYKAGSFKQFVFGKHYRRAWLAPVDVKLLDLTHEQGGLFPVKLGGGNQTKSLRLKNIEGKEFVLRSVQKYPGRLLPLSLQNTWVGDVLQDQISMSHPYGAFVIPGLAKSAGIYHKNSVLCFVPDDPRLGQFRDDYKNTLALFEERASKKLRSYDNFGNVERAISTPDMIAKIYEDDDNVVDEEEFLRNRLFDMWVGDWDRHEDQYRWAEFECGKDDHGLCYHAKEQESDKGNVYLPIPRDRDQVFTYIDGVLPWIVRRKWQIRALSHFDYKIKDVVGLNLAGRAMDESFLSRLSRDEWIYIAEDLQNRLTDSAIEKAFLNSWPDTIYRLDGPVIIEKLKSRRDQIVEVAQAYYEELAREVTVITSDKVELFEVRRRVNGNTIVTVYRDQDNREDIYYQREFIHGETREIRLYGLGGDDRFEITGEGKKGILVRIIGGYGEDQVIDLSRVSGLKKMTRVYDNPEGIKLNVGRETLDQTAIDANVNDHVQEKFNPTVVAPLLNFGFNPDDGVFLGAGLKINHFGWRKAPRAGDHKMAGAISLRSGAFNFRYLGNLYQVIDKLGIHMEAIAMAPNNITSFYGLGNDTPAEEDREFYRVRYDHVRLHAALQRQIGVQSFRLGPTYQFIQVERSKDRFISSDASDLPPSAFEKGHFLGIELDYQLSTVDDEVMPNSGVRWNVRGTWLRNLAGNKDLSRFQSDLSFFLTVNIPLKVTLAARFGGATNFEDFEFYQANTLGTQSRFIVNRGNLRGYQRDRFSGRSSVFQNTELRIKLFDFQSYLFPAEVGIFGFLDHGRVWIDEEASNTWHRGYGGGFWLSPADVLVLVPSVEFSKENIFFNLHLGFLF